MGLFEQLVAEIYSRGSESIAVFGGILEGDDCIQQSADELAKLTIYLMGLGRSFDPYLEIGAAAGGTTKFLADHLSLHDITIIDLKDPPHPHAHLRPRILHNRVTQEFLGDSRSLDCKQWLENLGKCWSLAFIDGGHDHETVLSDLDLAIPLMAPDGLILMHDHVAVPDVARAIHDRRGILGEPVFSVVSDQPTRKGIQVFQP